MSSDEYWECITAFLQKVIPVARQHDVKMACHPYDPPGLPFAYGYIKALMQAVNSEA